MATLTVYSNTADGYLRSQSSVYLTARSGANLTVGTDSSIVISGQLRLTGTSYCYESFLFFDTSPIGTGTVTSATLSLYAKTDQSDVDFTTYARARDWGATLTTGDWVAGASLSALTLLASASSAGISTSAYTAFSSESAFTSNVSTSGNTLVILTSARHESGDPPPTGAEYVT